MKALKKLAISFVFSAFMVVLFTISAQAASCTCGQSTKPHDSSHNKTYVMNDSSGHYILCKSCMTNGHSADCAQVILSENEAHSMSYSGNKGTCSKCGYEVNCTHQNATWKIITNTVGGTRSDDSTCVQYCDDCDSIVDTKEHNWKYRVFSSTSHSLYKTHHVVYCDDCSYIKDDDEAHTWKYLSYKKPAKPSNPVTTVSVGYSAAMQHIAYVQCTKCGLKTSFLHAHTYKSGKCTKCKLSNQSTLKITKLKKKKVKQTHKVIKYKGSWVWNGRQYVYHKPGKAHNYTTKITISWKKNSSAYGYYCSIGKPAIKTGKYITDQHVALTNGWNKSGGWDVVTKKTTATLSMSAAKKTKTVKIYVAPITKYGYIGKWTKLTVKVK